MWNAIEIVLYIILVKNSQFINIILYHINIILILYYYITLIFHNIKFKYKPMKYIFVCNDSNLSHIEPIIFLFSVKIKIKMKMKIKMKENV